VFSTAMSLPSPGAVSKIKAAAWCRAVSCQPSHSGRRNLGPACLRLTRRPGDAGPTRKFNPLIG